MNPIDTDRAKKLYKEYHDEMMSRSAWSGHEFAQDYLADLFTGVRSLLSEAYQGSSQNAASDYEAEQTLHSLKTDYGDLTTKTFSSGFFSEMDKKTVGDLLELKFLDHLDKAIDLLNRIYVKQTGHSLLEDIYPEEAKYNPVHQIEKACIVEDMRIYRDRDARPFVPFTIDLLNDENDCCIIEILPSADLFRISFKDISDDPLTITCVGKEYIPYDEIRKTLQEIREFQISKRRKESRELYPEDLEVPFNKE